ncbi:2-phosphosulfolactate phosphatase [Cellulomonas sp. APG4]|uniref:2-phosphosulfolactate phosphatase n=1 Tax=Cellulomonas sp. APG4 TaxID=1538656 RepID=UPI00137B8E00|nr:2-phosphosulfolactate phosphatase [Cellulomonas sp. APG4]
MDAWLGQPDGRLRLFWGPTGAKAALAADTDVVVVVDVLSFTTAVSVALDNGTEVIPFPERGAAAAAAAAASDAVLAAPREPRRVPPQPSGDDPASGPPSLSPASLRAAPPPDRLLLPSPNGARISAALGASGSTVIGACLRNATAVARWVVAEHRDATVAVVPAGERWPDGSLRPASEDTWGAGAVLETLLALGAGPASPEALDAVAAYRATCDRGLLEALRTTTSGLELRARGYAEDVTVAAELATSDAVPHLRSGRFTAA